MDGHGSLGLDAGREALHRFLAGDDDLDLMLTKVAQLALEHVEGCDLASITMLRRGEPTTPVCTDKVALGLDETQYEIGDGPCLSALRHHGSEHYTVATDPRWPEFREAAREAEVSAVLSTALMDSNGVLGALNLYSRSVGAFDSCARQGAALFADQLGLAAARVAALAEGYELAQQLQRAMETRAVIEQAKGILMGAEKCGPERAFEILKHASQHQNRKLHAIAQEIVDRYSTGS